MLAPHASPELRKDSKVEGMGYPAWVAGEGCEGLVLELKHVESYWISMDFSRFQTCEARSESEM